MESESIPPGILVPLDGSPLAEQALPYAQVLLPPGGELILLEVVENLEPIHGMSGWLLVPVEDVQRMFERQAHEYLQKAEATLRGEQPHARLEVVSGNPAVEILRVAAERGVDLIVMTTHGRGALGRWVFGSVADRVARSSPVPVLLVRPRESEPGQSQSAALSCRWTDQRWLRRPSQLPRRLPNAWVYRFTSSP